MAQGTQDQSEKSCTIFEQFRGSKPFYDYIIGQLEENYCILAKDLFKKDYKKEKMSELPLALKCLDLTDEQICHVVLPKELEDLFGSEAETTPYHFSLD